jgi:hypothetical protein
VGAGGGGGGPEGGGTGVELGFSRELSIALTQHSPLVTVGAERKSDPCQFSEFWRLPDPRIQIEGEEVGRRGGS